MRRFADHSFSHAADLGRQMMAWMFMLRSRAAGQGLVEYGLILVLVAITVVGILTIVGGTVSEAWYQKIVDAMP
jgi:pilus assembly protein Flp/PilA